MHLIPNTFFPSHGNGVSNITLHELDGATSCHRSRRPLWDLKRRLWSASLSAPLPMPPRRQSVILRPKSVPKRQAECERLLTSLRPKPPSEDRIFERHRRRLQHEGNRAPAGRTVRQPDRLQGEGAGGGNGAAFCHMCDRPTDRPTLKIRYCMDGRHRRPKRVWAEGGDRREGGEGREYESQQSTGQDMEGQSAMLRFNLGLWHLGRGSGVHTDAVTAL